MEKQFALSGKIPVVLLILILSLSGVIFLGYENHMLKQRKNLLESEALISKQDIKVLEENLASTTLERDGLAADLANQKVMVDMLSGKVSGIVSDVGTLVKLSKTDPELLKKYSKIYFLNENYLPLKLTLIDSKYTWSQKEHYFREDIWLFLKNMIDMAGFDTVGLQVISGYRSFDTQVDLKSSYKVTYGAGTANSFSADQGYSEHQLGTAVDFTTEELGANFDTFDKTKSYVWLLDNAYKYGFILSYPPNNAYYKFEPWHWRFVGRKLAGYLHTYNKNFYDLDQREIDTYLQNFFD